MLVLLNSAFDEWARRFDELRAGTDCPEMAAIDFLTGGGEVWDMYSKWLALPGELDRAFLAFLNHCGRVGREQIQCRMPKSSREQRAERSTWLRRHKPGRVIEHTRGEPK